MTDKAYILTMTDGEDVTYYHIPVEWGDWAITYPAGGYMPLSLIDAYIEERGEAPDLNRNDDIAQLLACESAYVGDMPELVAKLFELGPDIEIINIKGMWY